MMFTLDPRLEADSLFVKDLKLSQLRLMNDETYPWLLLIPQKAGLREFIDLSVKEHDQLTREIRQVSFALQKLTKPTKLNVAALGNMVEQLHIHIIARYEGDAAWPAPVWGKVPAKPYSNPQKFILSLQEALS